MGKVWWSLGACALWVSIPIFAEGPCATKRVDACGCHHVHGIKHCHPNRKTDKCQATVKGKLPLPMSTPETAPKSI
jgi:hypothetical protein